MSGRAGLWGAIPSKVDRIIRRWEYAAQILESLRFIAIHGFDHEGLELELTKGTSQLVDPLFPVVTHNYTFWELEDPVGPVFPGVTGVPFEIP